MSFRWFQAGRVFRPAAVKAQAFTIAGALLLAVAACHPRPAVTTPSTSSQNHPPSVRLRCEPCTIAAGQSISLAAEAADPDADTLSYAWSAPSGTLATPAASRSTWTAPAQDGPVPVAITVTDGKGGIATDAITIQVTKPGA